MTDEKAPILKSTVKDGTVYFPTLYDQRDADHIHYMKEFVRWLKRHGYKGAFTVHDWAVLTNNGEYEALLKGEVK